MEAQALATYLGPWALGKGSLQYKLTRAVSEAIKQGLLNLEKQKGRKRKVESEK